MLTSHFTVCLFNFENQASAKYCSSTIQILMNTAIESLIKKKTAAKQQNTKQYSNQYNQFGETKIITYIIEL